MHRATLAEQVVICNIGFSYIRLFFALVSLIFSYTLIGLGYFLPSDPIEPELIAFAGAMIFVMVSLAFNECHPTLDELGALARSMTIAKHHHETGLIIKAKDSDEEIYIHEGMISCEKAFIAYRSLLPRNVYSAIEYADDYATGYEFKIPSEASFTAVRGQMEVAIRGFTLYELVSKKQDQVIEEVFSQIAKDSKAYLDNPVTAPPFTPPYSSDTYVSKCGGIRIRILTSYASTYYCSQEDNT